MENRDSGPASIDVTASLSAAVQNLHELADEIGRVSQISFAQNAKLIEDLGAAQDIGDVIAIQTKFATGLFETFHEQFQRTMSRIAEFPGAVRFAEAWPGTSVAQNAEKAAETAPLTEPPASSVTDLPSAPTEVAQTSDEAQASDEVTVFGAIEKAEDSAIQQADQAAEAGREAWQELAKVAAELIRAEADESERETAQPADPETPPSADASARRA